MDVRERNRYLVSNISIKERRSRADQQETDHDAHDRHGRCEDTVGPENGP